MLVALMAAIVMLSRYYLWTTPHLKIIGILWAASHKDETQSMTISWFDLFMPLTQWGD